MNFKMKGFVSVVAFLVSGFSFADNQLLKTREGNDVNFYYNWNSPEGQNEIGFVLKVGQISNSFYDFKAPTQKELNNNVYKAVRDQLPNTGVYAKDIVLIQKQDSIVAGLGGSHTPKEIESINKFLVNTIKQSRTQFYKERRFVQDENWLLLDYKSISDEYKPKMAPIAEAFRTRNVQRFDDIRVVINDILSFYQSIPYDKLQTREIGDSEFGFSTPLKLIYQNRGDCDTKLVAVNSTLKNLYNVKTIAVAVPEHIFIGFKMTVQPGDDYIVYNGQKYVLAEPVGPAIQPIGKVSDLSYSYVKSGNYKIYEI